MNPWRYARQVVGVLIVGTTGYAQGAEAINAWVAFALVWVGTFIVVYTPEGKRS